MTELRRNWIGVAALVTAVFAATFSAGGMIARAQGAPSMPPGAVVAGSTWCGTVSGQYSQFLRELTPLVDGGAEIHGYLVHSDGDFSALVCKRGERSR
jgi:hypothetical protein